MTPSRNSDTERVTIALPMCEPDHPPYKDWSMADLVRGICPKCGCYVGHSTKAVREIRARHLIAESYGN